MGMWLQKSGEGRLLACFFGWIGALGPLAGATGLPDQSFDLLDNGGFEENVKRLLDEDFERIPWWRPLLWKGGPWQAALRGWPAIADLGLLPRVEAGELVISKPGLWLTQPVAGWTPGANGVQVTGRVLGQGRVVVRGGDGELFEVQIEGAPDGWRDFSWTPGKDGPKLQPRFEVALGSRGEGPVRFDDVQVHVPLYTVPEAELDEQVAELVVDLLDALLVQGRDRFGPRETSFWVGLHHVDTGKLLGDPLARVGYSPIHGYLVAAVRAGLGDRAGKSGVTLSQHLERMAKEFIELCIQPSTHLPRRYDPVADVPLDNDPIEVAAYLAYLIDLAGGDAIGSSLAESQDLPRLLSEELSDRALEAAISMGRALLQFAVLPDGKVAALVRASDGWISTSVVQLRRLDVPAQMVRLAALLRSRGVFSELQVELVAAAREAVYEVEYSNFWPGTWRTIDPGFDDFYGHIGARSQTMASAWPEEPALARLAFSGRVKFTPIWRDALAFGGNIAADQVRCWQVLGELVALDPKAAESKLYPELLRSARRVHFKGEQTVLGGWLDVTIFGFDPVTNLPVGDIIGLPRNQFAGLAFARHSRLDPDEDELRAFFATLLEVAKKDYLGPYGLAGERRSSGGGIRILSGLIGWL